MAKVLVDVVLKDGEDSTAFGNSFSSNSDVEVKNPMISNPTLIVMLVEESYWDTFKVDSRIEQAQRIDEHPCMITGTIPDYTTMSNKTIVVSSQSWDTNNPGSDYIGAQFYYDTDIIPSPPINLATHYWYITSFGGGKYTTLGEVTSLGIADGAENPNFTLEEGNTIKIYPPGTQYYIVTYAPDPNNHTWRIEKPFDRHEHILPIGTITDNPTIHVEVGDTINFLNGEIYNGHPLYIKTAPTLGNGDLVTTGTATNQGGDGGTLFGLNVTWDTTGVAPGTYYYQCGNHANMSGEIQVHIQLSKYNHPLYLKTAQGSGTGNQLAGVTNQGTNTEALPLEYTFPEGSSGIYYYQCSLHDAMYGTITVVPASGATVGSRTNSTGVDDSMNSYGPVEYKSRWTGKNVDIITAEVGTNYLAADHHENHPDYDDLENPGTSRFIPQDWPGLSDSANNQVSNGSERMSSHGCGVLSVAGGTICGFAKHSNLYQMSSGSDSFPEMYNAALTWHNNKSVNGATGKKNPTIVIGEVQWANWWGHAFPVDEVQAITWNGSDVVTRPAGGWGQAGSDLTPFVDRHIIPRQVKDPDTGNWVWCIAIPEQYEYGSMTTAINNCVAGGVHCISAASNQGQTYVKFSDPKYSNEGIRVNAGATRYNLGTKSPFNADITKTTTNTTSWSPWWNYGTHGTDGGIDVAAGQNSEEWSVLDKYTCRGPGIDIVGMGANTYSSNPDATFANGIEWGMFSGTSCATPTVVGKAACLLEKYFVYNNEYPTPAELKSILCQNKYYYGHSKDGSDDVYKKKYIMKSNDTISAPPGDRGGIDWSSIPVAASKYYYADAANGYLCQIEDGDSWNGWIVLNDLAGTTRQKASLNVHAYNRSQTRGPRPILGALYPRPRITRTDTIPSLV